MDALLEMVRMRAKKSLTVTGLGRVPSFGSVAGAIKRVVIQPVH